MTANMIRAVATPAPVRQAQTNTVAKTAIDNASKLGAAYGMKFNAQMEQVKTLTFSNETFCNLTPNVAIFQKSPFSRNQQL